MSKKKRQRSRVTPARAEKGKRLAFDLHKEGRLGYAERRQRICEAIGCSDSAAEKWMKQAVVDVLADVSDIVPGDLENSRWTRVGIWADRSRRYRGIADNRANAKKFNDASKCENLALQYEGLIVRTCHWDKNSPEQDLDDPEVRGVVIRIMSRKLAVFTTVELLDMYRALNAELVGRQRKLDLGEIDMERLETRARHEQATLEAMGAQPRRQRESAPPTPGEDLAAKI